MINVKNEVYTALKVLSSNVSDSYPSDWVTFPAIQYIEEENKVAEFTDGKEDKAYVRYKIDIWNNKSTSATALSVDSNISTLGLKRSQCQDVTDPTGLKHKLMRYEGIIDINTKFVFHQN